MSYEGHSEATFTGDLMNFKTAEKFDRTLYSNRTDQYFHSVHTEC